MFGGKKKLFLHLKSLVVFDRKIYLGGVFVVV